MHYDDLPDEPRRMWARFRLICRLLLCAFGAVFLAIALLFWLAGHALAMPPLSEQGCAVVADVAMVSRALAVRNVSKDDALPILTQIYEVSVHPHLWEVLAVTHHEDEKRSARAFANELLAHCIAHRGNLDQFLGEPS